jgi:lipoprotein-anchoring transpeptidase ErfK/SrfK
MSPNWLGRSTLALVIAGTAMTEKRAAAADAPMARPITTRRVVVSIPDRMLVLVENDRIVSTFPVAVGAVETPSPIGTFTIVNRVTNPTYYHPGKVVPPGTHNPLGTRWIGLNRKGYGIHGTDDPRSVGHARSSGCIRLRNADVERLFERLRPGDVVELHGERTPAIAPLFANVR